MDREAIDKTICEILVQDGPDAHVDGHELITDFIESILIGQASDWAEAYAQKHAGNLRFLKTRTPGERRDIPGMSENDGFKKGSSPLTIKSEYGFPVGTQILTRDGVDLCTVMAITSVSIDMTDIEKVTTATIGIACPKIEVGIRKAQWMTRNPATNEFDEMASITFKDGSVVDFGNDGVAALRANGDRVDLRLIADGRKVQLPTPSTE